MEKIPQAIAVSRLKQCLAGNLNIDEDEFDGAVLVYKDDVVEVLTLLEECKVALRNHIRKMEGRA